MTKKTIVTIASVVAITLIGCGKSDDDTVTISQEEFDELMEKAVQAESNKEAAQALKDLEDATGADIPIEELTGESEESEKNTANNDNGIKSVFPYKISDTIKKASFMDGTMQIYEDVFMTNLSMTPEDVADILNNSDRKDLYDVKIKYDENNIPNGVYVSRIGEYQQDSGYFVFEDLKKEEKLVFDDETINVTFGDEYNGYFLSELREPTPWYYTMDSDGTEYIPNVLYAGNISSGGYRLDGSLWTNTELIKEIEKSGYILPPEGIVRDDSVIRTAPGMYMFVWDSSAKNSIIVLHHVPEIDTYSFTYTEDMVEYVEHYRGYSMEFYFHNTTKIRPAGICEHDIIYRGKEALDKIETILREKGLESKISQKIHDAHIND